MGGGGGTNNLLHTLGQPPPTSGSQDMDLRLTAAARHIHHHPLRRPRCSRGGGDGSGSPENGGKNDRGDRLSTDWDKAWSSFRKKGKKSFFSQFNPNKYVSWNPQRSEYPISKEIDPIKRAERSNLMLWTSPKFTLIGAIVVVSLLLIYTILAIPPLSG